MILALNPKPAGKRLRPPLSTNFAEFVTEGVRWRKKKKKKMPVEARLGKTAPRPGRRRSSSSNNRSRSQRLTPRATPRKNNQATQLINIHKRDLLGGDGGVLFFNAPHPTPPHPPLAPRRKNNRGMFIIYTWRYMRAPVDKYFCILQSGMSGIARVLSLTTEEWSAEMGGVRWGGGEGGGVASQGKLVAAPPERDLQRRKTPGLGPGRKSPDLFPHSRFPGGTAMRSNTGEKWCGMQKKIRNFVGRSGSD